jgi:autotransporter-associated beta strand protein
VDFKNGLNLGTNAVATRTINVIDNPNSSADIARISGNITETTAGMGLLKGGAGTLELTGNNTYTGGTTVSTGTLMVNNTSGSGTGSGTVSVTSAPGTTLGGTGTVSGAVTVNGNIAPGSVAPDPLTGTLTTGAVDLNGNLVVEINGASADKLVSTGAIDLTGAELLVSELAGGFTAPSYVIAEGTSVVGTFDTVSAGYNVSYTPTQVILTKVAAAGYDSWKTLPANGLTAGVNDGLNDDPDFDGISNLLEFVLGGIPAGTGAADPSILPTQSLTPTALVLEFDRDELSDGDVTLKVQWSTDLATWGSPDEVAIGGASAGIVTVTENGAAPDTIEVAIPRGTNTKLFARVLVTRP